MYQCLDETQFESVIALTQASARPHTVLSSLLQKDPDTAASHKIFPKLKQKEKNCIYAGQTQIHAPMHGHRRMSSLFTVESLILQ